MQKYANFAETYIKPFGTIFLNLLKFIVVPIVLFSIMCGIISMKDIKKVGSIGAKTVVYYMCTTAFAITFGLIGANMFKGAFPKIATTDLSYKADQTISLMDTIVNIFPFVVAGAGCYPIGKPEHIMLLAAKRSKALSRSR